MPIVEWSGVVLGVDLWLRLSHWLAENEDHIEVETFFWNGIGGTMNDVDGMQSV